MVLCARVLYWLQASITVPKIMTEVVDNLAKLLLSRLVPGEKKISIVSNHMNMTLASDSPDKLFRAKLMEGDARLSMPLNWCGIAPKNVDCTSHEPISIKVCSVLTTKHSNQRPMLLSPLLLLVTRFCNMVFGKFIFYTHVEELFQWQIIHYLQIWRHHRHMLNPSNAAEAYLWAQ